MMVTHSWAKIGDDKIWESQSVKLLGINIDNQLKFDSYVLEIYSKANRRLSALARIYSMVELQINKVNRLHGRALRLVYNDYNSSFDDLLDKYKSVTVHHATLNCWPLN